jgi:hypothetical protein
MAASNVVNGLARATGQKGHEVTNAWAPDKRRPGPHWIELSWENPIEMNMVHVSFQTVDTAPQWFAVETWDRDDWIRAIEVADNRHRRHVLGVERVTTSKLRVLMEQPAAISEIRVYLEPNSVVESARRAHRTMRLPDEGPWLPWTVKTASQKFDGIVLDSADAEIRGYWVPSTWAGPFVGDSYLHDNDSGKGDKSIRFRFAEIPPGRYKINLAYRDAGNRASNTVVTLVSTDGAKTVVVDQRMTPPVKRLFYPLGEYSLDAKSTVEVTNTGTDGYVVVDAVQLLPVD